MQDEQLRPLLEMYRQAGRKVFIATNSLWDYTNVVMNFLLDGKVGAQRDTEWLRVCPPPPHTSSSISYMRVSHLLCQAPGMWRTACGQCRCPSACQRAAAWRV